MYIHIDFVLIIYIYIYSIQLLGNPQFRSLEIPVHLILSCAHGVSFQLNARCICTFASTSDSEIFAQVPVAIFYLKSLSPHTVRGD